MDGNVEIVGILRIGLKPSALSVGPSTTARRYAQNKHPTPISLDSACGAKCPTHWRLFVELLEGPAVEAILVRGWARPCLPADSNV